MRPTSSHCKHFARISVAALACLMLFPVKLGGQALPEANVDTGHRYVLRAVLNPETHTVSGEVQIQWRNDSRVRQSELYLHLYLNAFASNDTVFMKESGGQLRGVDFVGNGSIELRELSHGGNDLLANADNELIDGDHTQLRVSLPGAVGPGESIELRGRFVSTLPPLFARSGYHGDFHMVAQWFPKVARLEPDGTWESFPYHGVGEFYADFATYELHVETPAGWEVGATGVQVGEVEVDGRIRRHFVATRVHDCAFATAPWFEMVEHSYERPDGTTVAVHILHPPGYRPSIERHWQVARDGLQRFGRILGQYPYAQLTIIVPPRGADGAAGMEYPMLFVSGGPWFAFGGAPIAIHEELTAHELGHQWFQGLVATNEVKWPALDEGLTEWITGDLLQARHGRDHSGVKISELNMDGFEGRRAWALLGSNVPPPPARSVREFRMSTLGRSVYARTSVILETIARTWGRRRLHRALGAYARRHRFAHPGPEDLMQAFAEEYGAWMPERVLRPALFHGAFAALHLRQVEIDGNETRIVADREGELPIPTQIKLIAADGRSRRLDWPGQLRHFDQRVPGQWIGAIADPDHHGLLDYSRLDDVARVPEAPPTRSSPLYARLIYFFQALMRGVGP